VLKHPKALLTVLIALSTIWLMTSVVGTLAGIAWVATKFLLVVAAVLILWTFMRRKTK
jgi:hypothetical protein